MAGITRRAAIGAAVLAPLSQAAARPPFFRGGSGGGATTETGTIPTITEIAADRIYQRAPGSQTKTVTFAGTYTGNPSSLQIKLTDASAGTTIQDWTNLSSQSITGGNWSGNLSVPQGAWYKWQARFTHNVAVTGPVSTNAFGVGMLIACIGQSNMFNMWTSNSGAVTPNAKLRYFDDAVAWQTYAIAQPMIEWGNALRTLAVAAGADIPIGFLQYAISGTAIATWLTAANSGTHTSWDLFVHATTGVNAAACGGDFEQVVWYQGESDANGNMATATYKSNLTLLKNQLFSQTGRDSSSMRIGIVTLANTANYTDAKVDAIRRAQLQWQSENSTFAFYAGTTLDGLHGNTDALHFVKAQYVRFGKRYARSCARAAVWLANGAEGPSITGVAATGGSANVTLTVTQAGGTGLRDGTGGASASGLVGFLAQINGSPVTVNAASLSGNTITLTLASAPSSGNTVGVQYGYGQNPFGFVFDGTDVDDHVTYDNQSIGDTTGVPLRPTDGYITATAA